MKPRFPTRNFPPLGIKAVPAGTNPIAHQNYVSFGLVVHITTYYRTKSFLVFGQFVVVYLNVISCEGSPPCHGFLSEDRAFPGDGFVKLEPHEAMSDPPKKITKEAI